MIYFQVEDVDKKFKNLTDVEANNWIEMVVQPVLTKKKIKTKTAVVAVGPKKVASSGLKALIAAKRRGSI